MMFRKYSKFTSSSLFLESFAPFSENTDCAGEEGRGEPLACPFSATGESICDTFERDLFAWAQ